MLLESKVALITGGARGIGAEIAKKFVEHKAKVLICDVDKDAGLKTVQEIGKGNPGGQSRSDTQTKHRTTGPGKETLGKTDGEQTG